MLGESHLRLAERLQELVPKNFTRVRRDTFLRLHFYPLW